MKLTKEQLMAAARSVASEHFDNDLYGSGTGKLTITLPSIRGGWRASRDGTRACLSESKIIIRALVLQALQDD